MYYERGTSLIGTLVTLLTAASLIHGAAEPPTPSPPYLEASAPGPTVAKAELIPDLVVAKPEPKAEPPEPTYEIYEVTAYTAYEESTDKGPDHPAFGITASGERVKAGHTIACPRSIPFGTRLEIESVGVRTCVDRGGAIKNRKLDVYIPSLKEAREFGRKRLRVTILKEAE